MSEILTIAEAARRIAARQLSPVELATMQLDRIRRLDPQLHAFLLVTEERALADARAAEARQMAGTLRGRLDGIPIAHKDIYNTAGIRTTAHSRLLQDNVPTRDVGVRHLARENNPGFGRQFAREREFDLLGQTGILAKLGGLRRIPELRPVSHPDRSRRRKSDVREHNVAPSSEGAVLFFRGVGKRLPSPVRGGRDSGPPLAAADVLHMQMVNRHSCGTITK